VQLEAVGGVAVRDLGLEVGGQVDDADGVEGAFFGADAAADAEAFGDEGDFAVGGDFDAEFAGFDDWMLKSEGLGAVETLVYEPGHDLCSIIRNHLCLTYTFQATYLLHSCLHFFGLHLSLLTIAILGAVSISVQHHHMFLYATHRVNLSDILAVFRVDLV
jgi:hypothetical protein